MKYVSEVSWQTWVLAIVFLLLGVYQYNVNHYGLNLLYILASIGLVISESATNRSFKSQCSELDKSHAEMIDNLTMIYQGRSSKNGPRDEESISSAETCDSSSHLSGATRA